MKKGYTLVEIIVVMGIILILLVPVLNVRKAYLITFNKIQIKGAINELSNTISLAKYYCSNLQHRGVIEIDTSNKKIKFKDISLKYKLIKEVQLPDNFVIQAESKSLYIDNKGHIQSATITFETKYHWGKVTIATGVDTVNAYEGGR